MDKCREAFERFECEKYEANYDDMKKNWDWYESQFGYRYSPDSLRGKDWAVWQKAWQHQQAKVEELQTHAQEIHKREIKLFEKTLILTHERDELQKRVDLQQKLLEIYRVLSEDQLDNCADNLIARINGLEQALKGEGQ